jgi:uncharacterized membrane-anchored protein
MAPNLQYHRSGAIFQQLEGMPVLRTVIVGLAASFALVASAIAQSQSDAQSQNDVMSKIFALGWIKAPAIAPIAGVARIKLTNGQMALGESDTSRFVELNGNPPSHNNFAVSAPDFQWFAVFAFDPSGYVKDDEKIDPDALLDTLKEQNKNGIEERKRLGLDPLVLEGWYVPPHYDVETKRLEWGTKLSDSRGNIIVNYSIRVLGRSGVLKALLVSDPTTLDHDLKDFHSALLNLTFDPGQQYSEFRPGDKVAEYGLAALVVGGAAAVAMKAGAGFFKVIVVAVLAFIGVVGSFIKRLFSRNKKTT